LDTLGHTLKCIQYLDIALTDQSHFDWVKQICLWRA